MFATPVERVESRRCTGQRWRIDPLDSGLSTVSTTRSTCHPPSLDRQHQHHRRGSGHRACAGGGTFLARASMLLRQRGILLARDAIRKSSADSRSGFGDQRSACAAAAFTTAARRAGDRRDATGTPAARQATSEARAFWRSPGRLHCGWHERRHGKSFQRLSRSGQHQLTVARRAFRQRHVASAKLAQASDDAPPMRATRVNVTVPANRCCPRTL